jgi:hypothetical protein
LRGTFGRFPELSRPSGLCGFGFVASMRRRTASSLEGSESVSDTSEPHRDVELMAAIGGALGSWSQVETGLEVFFCHASGILSLEKATAVFGAIVAFEARLAVCDSIMAVEDVSDLEREMWARLSARIRKFYRKRHEVAHFSFVFEGTPRISPFFTWGKEHSKQVKYLSAAQISERALKFTSLSQAVGWFTNRAIERRGLKLGPRSQVVEAARLIPHIRALAARTLEARAPPPRSSEA